MKLEVSIDSGANIHSQKTAIVDVEDLGFNEANWRALDEDSQMAAVIRYWNEQGRPEICFKEIE